MYKGHIGILEKNFLRRGGGFGTLGISRDCTGPVTSGIPTEDSVKVISELRAICTKMTHGSFVQS